MDRFGQSEPQGSPERACPVFAQDGLHTLSLGADARRLATAASTVGAIASPTSSYFDHVAASFRIERDDFEDVPFNQKGGLGRVHQVFAGKLDELLEELNEVLVA